MGLLFVLLAREIRARRRAQSSLQAEVAVREQAEQASRTYADLARHVEVGLVVWRRRPGPAGEYELVAANPRAEALAPERAYARVGAALGEVHPADEAAEFTRVFAEVSRTGRSVDLGERTVSREGAADVVLAARVFPLPDGCVGAAYDDVTARRAAADELRRALESTERVNRELESFSYTVSHDLRAPLRGIDGFSLALLEEYGAVLDETGRSYLNRVRAGTQRMGALIDDLLGLAKVSRADLRRGPVDLAAMVREVDAEIRQGEAGREVEMVVAPEATVLADPALLRVAVENLLRNAWKFTSKRERARIEFGVRDEGGPREFFVRDDGAGFDPAHAGKLFGAFQRLHAAQEFPGTGIGLATVQRIVSRHGGRVWAEGKVGAGATFYFAF
jgi:signal transduction histidine kinase